MFRGNLVPLSVPVTPLKLLLRVLIPQNTHISIYLYPHPSFLVWRGTYQHSNLIGPPGFEGSRVMDRIKSLPISSQCSKSKNCCSVWVSQGGVLAQARRADSLLCELLLGTLRSQFEFWSFGNHVFMKRMEVGSFWHWFSWFSLGFIIAVPVWRGWRECKRCPSHMQIHTCKSADALQLSGLRLAVNLPNPTPIQLTEDGNMARCWQKKRH